MTRTEVWDKFWKDKHGKVVLWQSPNLPLWVWFGGTILGKLLPAGSLKSLAEIIAFGAIFTWAWLEISQGVNYFRRTLAAVVLAASLYSRLHR